MHIKCNYHYHYTIRDNFYLTWINKTVLKVKINQFFPWNILFDININIDAKYINTLDAHSKKRHDNMLLIHSILSFAHRNFQLWNYKTFYERNFCAFLCAVEVPAAIINSTTWIRWRWNWWQNVYNKKEFNVKKFNFLLIIPFHFHLIKVAVALVQTTNPLNFDDFDDEWHKKNFQFLILAYSLKHETAMSRTACHFFALALQMHLDYSIFFHQNANCVLQQCAKPFLFYYYSIQ